MLGAAESALSARAEKAERLADAAETALAALDRVQATNHELTEENRQLREVLAHYVAENSRLRARPGSPPDTLQTPFSHCPSHVLSLPPPTPAHEVGQRRASGASDELDDFVLARSGSVGRGGREGESESTARRVDAARRRHGAVPGCAGGSASPLSCGLHGSTRSPGGGGVGGGRGGLPGVARRALHVAASPRGSLKEREPLCRAGATAGRVGSGGNRVLSPSASAGRAARARGELVASPAGSPGGASSSRMTSSPRWK